MTQYFETIRCEEEEAFNLEYHEKRMAKAVAMNFNLNEYIYPPSLQCLKCKVIYDESGILNIEFSPYKKRDIQTFKLVYHDMISYSKKLVNRDRIELLFNKRDTADEIIIIKNGLVTDTSIANIALFDGSHWITPKQPLLEGTTRARLLNEQVIFERDITVDMLKNAPKIALLNAMIGMDILEDYSLLE